MSTTARMEQIADMVAYYRTRRTLGEIGVRVGFSAPTVLDTLNAYGGVTMRPKGHYAQQPRLNEYATPETWRCTDCKRGLADGVVRASGKYASYCRPCQAARSLAWYYRTRERTAS